MEEMNEAGEETSFEIGVVVPKSSLNEGYKGCDCVELLVSEFRKAGLIVERVNGLSDEFIKVSLFWVSQRLVFYDSSFIIMTPLFFFWVGEDGLRCFCLY